MHSESFEVLGGEAVAYFGKRGQAQVGLVDAELADGFVIIHTRKGCLDCMSRGFKRSGQETFHYFPHAFWLRIRHLEIDLREFRLAVGAQVLVTEAAYDLEILVETGDHQDLLEQLGRLRK